ncbi:hypothetical protein Tco_1416917 [Tanacetum coccineum]
MTNTRSGMTPAIIEEMINEHVDVALEARRVNRYLKLGNGNDNGGGDGNGNGTRNGNNGCDNGDGDENHNENGRGDSPVARECTYQDFMKCQPLGFKGTKGVVGLIRWSENMETVCWEVFIPDLVPLEEQKPVINLYLTKLIMSGSQDEIPPPPPPPSSQTPTQQTPHTVSTIKLPILKKGEYDIWAMKMEHYLAHTDYPIWEVIQNGNGPVSITTDTQGQIKVLPPRTAEEILARERERKARTTLLMALPEDHLAKFHKMTDAKEMWDAIKSRFGGNDESKKMQKYILKQQLKGFSESNLEGLHKGTKPGVDSLSFDDLYNNLRVFENDVKGFTSSSSSTQNVAFVSKNTISTNDVSTAYGVSNPSGHNSQYEQTSSYSLLANQSSCPQLDHEDLEQLDETKGNQDSKRRDAWNFGNKGKENGRRSGKQEDSKALVTIDGEGVDWTSHSEEEEDYALMAYNGSGLDTEVTSCSK